MGGLDEIGEQLGGWGKVALLETTGRVTRSPVRAAVGFVEEPDGSLLVAAGSEDADWSMNLRSDPVCTAKIGDRSGQYAAQELASQERNEAITALILKYGTPAERLGRGPAFRLRPVTR